MPSLAFFMLKINSLHLAGDVLSVVEVGRVGEGIESSKLGRWLRPSTSPQPLSLLGIRASKKLFYHEGHEAIKENQKLRNHLFSFMLFMPFMVKVFSF